VTEGKGRAAVLREASLLVAVFFLGTNPVAIKLAVLDVPPLPFVAIRFLLAGLVLLPVALLLGRGREVGRRSMTTASDTALIYAATPIWGILLGLALGLESPRLWGIAGVALAVLGVGVVVYGGLGGRGSSLEGDLLVVVATVCWGSYAVLSLPLLRTYSPIVVASYTMLFGGLAALPLALPINKILGGAVILLGVYLARRQ
jgi:drug/metabolite transporter (DMT)-like permease